MVEMNEGSSWLQLLSCIRITLRRTTTTAQYDCNYCSTSPTLQRQYRLRTNIIRQTQSSKIARKSSERSCLLLPSESRPPSAPPTIFCFLSWILIIFASIEFSIRKRLTWTYVTQTSVLNPSGGEGHEKETADSPPSFDQIDEFDQQPDLP